MFQSSQFNSEVKTEGSGTTSLDTEMHSSEMDISLFTAIVIHCFSPFLKSSLRQILCKNYIQLKFLGKTSLQSEEEISLGKFILLAVQKLHASSTSVIHRQGNLYLETAMAISSPAGLCFRVLKTLSVISLNLNFQSEKYSFSLLFLLPYLLSISFTFLIFCASLSSFSLDRHVFPPPFLWDLYNKLNILLQNPFGATSSISCCCMNSYLPPFPRSEECLLMAGITARLMHSPSYPAGYEITTMDWDESSFQHEKETSFTSCQKTIHLFVN